MIGKAVAKGDEALGEILRRDRQFRALALQFGQQLGSGCLELAPPFGNVPGAYGFRGKIGVVVTLLCQRSMHLGSADAKLARQCKKENIGIRQVGRPGAARQQRVIEVTSEIIQSLGPAVSLITDKAEEHAKSVFFRRIFAVESELHGCQKRRCVREPGPLDQKTRHLDLGMRTGLQAPIDFEHPVIVEDHRAVRLFYSNAADDQALRRRNLVEDRRLATADLAAFQWHGRVPLDCVHHRQCKTVLR